MTERIKKYWTVNYPGWDMNQLADDFMR
jgi:hypothetical protein